MSGAAGLLYEIYWAQRFSLLLGVDVYSHAAVLTAFMGGLALGSHVLGRRGDRFARPLAVYALLELGIAVLGLLVPVVLTLAMGPMRWMYALTDGQPQAMLAFRFAVAVIILVVPTALMGGTLPVMTRVLRQQGDRLGVVVGRLYAVNTIGAVVGIVAGGFILSEFLGLTFTNLTAVVLNLAAAGLAFQMLKSSALAPSLAAVDGAPPSDSVTAGDRESSPVTAPSRAAPQHPDTQPSTPSQSVEDVDASRTVATAIAICAGLTGAAAMITQIGWIRVITLLIGSSSYAFSLVVAVFLTGLSLGAWLTVRAVRWWSDAAVPWAFSCLVTATLSWIVMWALSASPASVLDTLQSLVNRGASVPRIYMILGFLTFLLLGAPTVALGMTFPLACETYAQRFRRGTARISGALYAMNTIGAMLGLALGGLVLIGLLGIHGTLIAGAVLYLLTGLVIATMADVGERKRFPGVAGFAVCAAVAAIVGALPWDRAMLLSAPYTLQSDFAPDELIYYREAPEGTIAVEREDLGIEEKNIILLINGKPDASTMLYLGTHKLLAHVPMLLHGSADDVAVIGLGGGVTLGSVLTYPVQSVDMVEISEAVVEAVRPPDGSPGPFDHVNHRPLDDPRVRLIIGDGRNHLALTQRKYDVIISEPSNPWMAGVASLFTREFFETCHSRLSDDGILCQWLQGYDLPKKEFYRVLRTMDEVFDSVTVWVCTPPSMDFLIIAAPRARPAIDSLAKLVQIPAVRRELGQLNIAQPAAFWGLYMLDAADLKSADGGGSFTDLRPNTDNWNKLAFSSIRALWDPTPVDLYGALWSHCSLPLPWTGPLDVSNPEHAHLAAGIQDLQDVLYLVTLWDATFAATYGQAILWLGGTWHDRGVFLAEYRDYRSENRPPKPDVLKRRTSQEARRRLALITDSASPRDNQRAARQARFFALVAVAADPADGDNMGLLAEALWRMGRTDQARGALRQAIARSATVRPELMQALLPGEEAPAPAQPQE